MRETFLPFCRPSMGKEEEEAVIEVLRSGWLTTGAKSFELEKKFAEYKKCKYAITFNSCTSAIHVAMVVSGVKAGDEVITPPITWPSTVNSILHLGAKPVFADVDPTTLNLDPGVLEERITPKTRAIIPVHMAGRICNMSWILHIAQKRNIPVIEDAAHAIESEWCEHAAGTMGQIGCFSMYANKNLTTGEGGILITNDEATAEKARLYGSQGIDKDAWKRYGDSGYKHWEVAVPGYKYNMPDVLAAIGVCQLRKVDMLWKDRQMLTNLYDKGLKDISEIALPDSTTDLGRMKHGHHLYIIKVRPEMLKVDRDGFLNALQAQNIGVGVHFRAAHLFPAYKMLGYKKGDLPAAEWASDRIISLPLYPRMTVSDAQDVVEAVRKVAKENRR